MVSRLRVVKLSLLLSVSVAVVALSLFLAARGWVREPGPILLFVPLMWGFRTLRTRGMILCGLGIAAARVAVEAVHTWQAHDGVNMKEAFAESLFPILLYVALGVVFYVFRRREALLVSRVIEVSAMEARDRLAGSLAHDFTNLLTVIIGTSKLMLRGKPADEQARTDAQTVLNTAQQALALVRQMRQVRDDAGEGPTTEDLSDLADRQIELVERALPPNIHVVRYSTGALPVRVDKAKVFRVLMNLCLNARDAMGESGGVLTVRTDHRTFDGREMAELSVSDTGPGIDPPVMRRLFDPFFTTRAAAGGAGLGLSIVQSIARAYGGEVEAKNIPGAGALFSFMIPLEPLPTSQVA